MSKAEPLIRKSPVITLKGDELRAYVDVLKRLIGGGRTSKFFPDAAAICNMMSFYLTENCHGLYDSLEINRDTGFPSEKEITRIVTDLQLAPRTLAEDPESVLRERAQKTPSDVNTRRLGRHLYHKALMERPLPSLLSLRLQLRSLDTEKYIAFFNAELDKFDPSGSLFTRYTLVVGQHDSRWNQQVLLQGDDIKLTRNFRNLISRYTADEAEFAFVLLNDLPDVTVEEVQRCRIGPVYFRGVRIPEGMEPLFQAHPQGFILSLPTDRASISQKEDVNNDPLASLYRDTLGPDEKKTRDAKAAQMGYRVFKERKLICTRPMLEPLRKFLKDRGARCVVYGV